MQTVVHSSYVIEKRFSVRPEKVFQAFADPAKKRRWMADERGGPADFQIDFKVGGSERIHRSTAPDSPLKGLPLTNETTYLDIVQDRRIVFAYTMAVADQRISASLVTIELAADGSGGTEMLFTEQAAFFEHADGAQIREHGWRELLKRLEATL